MRRGERLAAAAAALAAPLPFLPAARAGFLAWDDQSNLVYNAAYRGFSRAHLAWMWTTHFRGPWQPLSWLSYAADWTLWGLDAPAYRRTNLLLHALAAGLCVLVARRLLDAALGARVPERARNLGALAAGLTFALHPLRVESVVWVTERRDVLSGVFVLAAWLAYLEERFVLAPFLFAGALLSKGTAVALPIFLLACEYYPLGRLPAQGRAVAWRLSPYFLLALAAGFANLGGFGTGDLSVPWIGPGLRLAIAAHAPGFYLLKTLLPFDLSPYYPLIAPPSRLYVAFAVYAAVGVLATVSAYRFRRRTPWAWAAWLAFLAALAPVSGLLQNGAQIAADRYTYLPCLPFVFVIGGCFATAAAKRPRSAGAGLALLAAVLAALTWRQSAFWRDEILLWTRAVALAPDGYLPRSNLASADLAAGDADGAMAQYREVLRLRPGDFGARVNMGVLLEKRGRLEEAETVLRAALALRPGADDATVNLANVLSARGRRSAALALLTDLAAREPGFAPGRFNRGLLLIALGRRAEGREELRAAVASDPGLARRLGRAP
ncbi:MAG: tetratricopeptide repeat protein [Elusimicrobia bacterium]|nr:tetratricopeptide repeat protein [Elusimicrobiota bacterium]